MHLVARENLPEPPSQGTVDLRILNNLFNLFFVLLKKKTGKKLIAQK